MGSLRSMFWSLVLVTACAALLAGCGDGGGVVSTPTAGPGTSSVVVSGVVTSAGGAGGSGSASKAQAGGGNPVANAVVTISSFNKEGREIDKITAITPPTGTYNERVNVSNDGGYIIITVESTGFADASKRIDFSEPSEINVPLELDKVETVVASKNNATLSASTGEKVIKFAVFESANGKKVVKTGKDVEVLKQQGSNPTLEIQIPASSLPDDITSLVAQLKTFDPINDADKFPGQYMDANGNKLVSLGFDFINIKADNGQNLGEVVQAAVSKGKVKKSQAGNSTRISRWINRDSCSTLLKDFCVDSTSDEPLCYSLTTEERAGFNVPVYTYNPRAGLWEMLGIGTLDLNADGSIDTNDVIAGDNVDERDYQGHCSDDKNNGVYLVIYVTNEAFIQSYWNLDYPLIFEQPKELCTVLTLKDDSGNPLSGVWTYLYDDDSTMSFSSAWGSTDSDGKSKLSIVLTNSSDQDYTATVRYSNPFDWSLETQSVTLGEAGNCTTSEYTITKLTKCQVEGYVKDESNNGVPNKYVYAYGETSYDYRYAYTNSDGKYVIDVQCQFDYGLYGGWNWEKARAFNVNITQTTVVLEDIILQNQAPYAYGWLSSTSIYANSSITAYVYGWDSECDQPLKWSISGVPSQITGTTNDCWFYDFVSIPFSAVGTYDLTLQVEDSKGKKSEASLGTVYVVTENRPPVIQYAYPSAYSVPKDYTDTVTLYGSAYDLDGDNLSWTWYANNSPIEGCAEEDGYTGSISTTCEYSTPNIDGVVAIRFEVSDGQDTVSREFYVTVGDTGQIDVIIQKR